MSPGFQSPRARAWLPAVVLVWAGAARAAAQDPTASAAPPQVASQPGSAQIQPLAELLEPIRARHQLPALAAALLHERELLALGATGTRRMGFDEPVLENDRWHLGSCTKALTATLCARLVERGLLRWDTRLEEVFPELLARMSPAWRTVTLTQLLAHRAGAPATLDADGLWGKLWQREGTPREQRRQLLEAVVAKEPASTPGTAFLYSNAGYAIAGAMAETVARLDFEDLMAREVFEPLGMHSAGFGAPGTPGLDVADAPWGHRGPMGALLPVSPGMFADNPAAIAPAGTVHCSLSDWARFAALHAFAPAPDSLGKPYLSQASLSFLHTPVGDSEHALGWISVERSWAGGRALTHAGSNTMWYCVAWLAPDKHLGVLVATNAAGEQATRACDEVAGALLKLGETLLAPPAVPLDASAPPQSAPEEPTQGG